MCKDVLFVPSAGDLDAHIFYLYLFLCISSCTRSESGNPGNTLYVTGLSTRVTERDLEEHFSREGKVGLFISFTFLVLLFIVHLITTSFT